MTKRLNIWFMELCTPCCWYSKAQNVQELKHCKIIKILNNFVHFLFYIVVTVTVRNQVGTLDKVTIKGIYYIATYSLAPTPTLLEAYYTFLSLHIKIIKQFTSNTSYFIMCEATYFGPHRVIFRSSYESSR